MQIVGRRYADADVLAASAVFRPWQQAYQTCASRAI
jgi:amidase/aspartyl-tRNA(Asn)/glutamyl-tRNA(Gln) amidotransferase subunit A